MCEQSEVGQKERKVEVYGLEQEAAVSPHEEMLMDRLQRLAEEAPFVMIYSQNGVRHSMSFPTARELHEAAKGLGIKGFEMIRIESRNVSEFFELPKESPEILMISHEDPPALIVRQFRKFNRDNPHIARHLEALLARDMEERGYCRVRTAYETLREDPFLLIHGKGRGSNAPKLKDSHMAAYIRLLLAQHPDWEIPRHTNGTFDRETTFVRLKSYTPGDCNIPGCRGISNSIHQEYCPTCKEYLERTKGPEVGQCGLSGCRGVSHQVNDNYCPDCKKAIDRK